MIKQENNKIISFNDKIKSFIEDYFKFPFYILFHPIKGFDDFKLENKGKLHVAITYIILMILALSYETTSKGFLLNPTYDGSFNIIRMALIVIVPVLLGTLGNWSITSLLDGKGKLVEIFKVIGYGLIPYVWFSFPLTFVSQFLIQEELLFYITIVNISVFLSVYLIFMGLLVVHEYGLLKTILTILFTAIAIGIIIFIGLLILTLGQQIYNFIDSVYREIIMRLN